jgi:23S rRNA pseudouridine955/2504/2580 synthase
MSQVTFLTIDSNHHGQRLDRWLKKSYPHLPFGQLQKLIRTGQIRIDGKRAKADTVLNEGQEMRLPPLLNASPSVTKREDKVKVSDQDRQMIRNMIVAETPHLIALNKPHGLAVQGGSKTTKHIDELLPALKTKDGFIPKLAHRIDKDTSGLLLCSKTNPYARKLGDDFKQKRIIKIYIAICAPAPEINDGTIIAPLLKSQGIKGQERVVIDEEKGQFAHTDFIVLDRAGKDAALIAFIPRTGRTHQIRVHSQTLGSPIIGEGKYPLLRETCHDQLMFEHYDAARSGMIELCSYKGLHLHAHTALIPKENIQQTTTKKKKKINLDHYDIITAPLSPEMKQSLKTLGFRDDVDSMVQDIFTKL